MASIEIVAPAGYLAFIERVKEGECYTHLAQVHSSAHGPIEAYAKFYPDQPAGSRGLANEMCGYVLAKALGLAVPRSGILLFMEGRHLAAAHPALAPQVDPRAEYHVWVTERVRGAPVSRRDESARTALRRWAQLPALIAFDDWVLNRDRHMGNLMRMRGSGFALIDHGHVFGGLIWDEHLLTADAAFNHPFLRELWDGALPHNVAGAILQSVQDHAAALAAVHDELSSLTSGLLGEAVAEAALGFLAARAISGADRVRTGLGMLL